MKLFILFFITWSIPVFAVLNGQGAGIVRNSDHVQMRGRAARLILVDAGATTTFCSGAVLDESEVVSVGHCLTDARQELLRRGQLFVEVATKEPPYYRRFQIEDARHKVEFPVDLALFKIRGRMPVDRSIPIALDNCDADSNVESIGFGVKDSSGKTSSLGQRAAFRLQPKIRGLTALSRLKGMPCVFDSGSAVYCRVKNQLSLLTVISFAQDHEPRSLNRDGWTDAQICNSNNRIFGTDLSQQRELLTRWRSEMNPPVAVAPPAAGDTAK